MSGPVLEAVAAKIVDRLKYPERTAIVWHGGEPTTAGLSWFRNAYAVLANARSKGIRFAIQTNGIAIDSAWLEFFSETDTSLGLSIDGPERFHDARRRTKSGGKTWWLAMRALKLAQSRGFQPNIISVISAQSIAEPQAFYDFYRSNRIYDISLSIDEAEGANAVSSYAGKNLRAEMVSFIANLLEWAWRDNYPLRIKEVERIGSILAGLTSFNEQVVPWAMMTISAEGYVSTFSPELMEQKAPEFDNFRFGNVVSDEPRAWEHNPALRAFQSAVQGGVDECRASCRYFHVCGGGAPVNKVSERGSAGATETSYCRLTTQAAAEALAKFVLTNRAKVSEYM